MWLMKIGKPTNPIANGQGKIPLTLTIHQHKRSHRIYQPVAMKLENTHPQPVNMINGLSTFAI